MAEGGILLDVGANIELRSEHLLEKNKSHSGFVRYLRANFCFSSNLHISNSGQLPVLGF